MRSVSSGAFALSLVSLAGAALASVPRRAVAAFGIGYAVLLSLAWLKGIVERTVAGTFGWPTGPDAVGHVVHALDLGLQVPLGLAAGILLLRRESAGVLVGGIMLVQAVLFTLCAGLAFAFFRGMTEPAAPSRGMPLEAITRPRPPVPPVLGGPAARGRG